MARSMLTMVCVVCGKESQAALWHAGKCRTCAKKWTNDEPPIAVGGQATFAVMMVENGREPSLIGGFLDDDGDCREAEKRRFLQPRMTEEKRGEVVLCIDLPGHVDVAALLFEIQEFLESLGIVRTA